MKKLNTIITLITLMGVLIVTSCKKDEEEPTPTTPGGTTGTTYVPTLTVNATGDLVAPATGEITATITNFVADSVDKIEVLNGSTVLTTVTTSPVTYTLPNLTGGTYTYTIKVTTKSGNVTTKDVSFVVTVNNSPTFTSTSTTTNATGVVDLTSMVSDVENNTITVTTATSTGATISDISGKTFKVNSTSGTVTVTVTISDGNSTTTNDLTITVTPAAITYGMMSGFFDRVLSPSNPSGLRFNSNGTVSTGVNDVNFWGGSCTYGTWSINSSGQIVIVNGCNTGTNTYNVTISSFNDLVLTNIVTSTVWGGK